VTISLKSVTLAKPRNRPEKRFNPLTTNTNHQILHPEAPRKKKPYCHKHSAGTTKTDHLDLWGIVRDNTAAKTLGGVLVSTWGMRQERHAEDGSLASLIIGPKHKR